MDERNYQHSYENGSTKPPKNRGGIIAVVLCTVIFLCGILSALGMWEQNNIHNNPQIGDVNFSGDNGSGSVSSMPSSLGAAQPPNPSDQIQVLTPTRKGGVGTWSPDYCMVIKNCNHCIVRDNVWHRGSIEDGIVLLGENPDVVTEGNIAVVAVRHYCRYNLNVLPLVTESLLPCCDLASKSEVISYHAVNSC